MHHVWKLGKGEYWPNLTGQRLIGDLMLKDNEMLTRTELEFLHQRDSELKVKQIDVDYEAHKPLLKTMLDVQITISSYK